MAWRRHLYLVGIGALCVLSCVGCAGGRRPINAGTGQVDVFVWIVLAPSELLGDRTNRGCRLTLDEVTDRMRHLQSNSSIYGLNTRFAWSPDDIGVIHDLEIPAGGPTQRTQTSSLWSDPANGFLVWSEGYWLPDHVNVYFVGNVQPGGSVLPPTAPPNPRAIFAGTIDPAVPGTFEQSPAYIRLNDGGFDLALGFLAPPDPATDPSAVTSLNVLEHEMAHYLGRFSSRTFAATGSQYDSGEHDVATPAPRNNVLRAGGSPPAFPLVIPGSVRGYP